MAGSRLDRIGTIFSRATGLLKAGAVKYQDRPVWYDIYRVFPPKYEPHIDRVPEKTEVAELLYPEDRFRAKFGRNPGGIVRNFSDRNFEDPSQPFVKICLELMKNNRDWSETQVLETAIANYNPSYLTNQGSDGKFENIAEDVVPQRIGRKSSTTITAHSLLSLFKEAKEQQKQSKADEGDKDDAAKKS